MEAGQNADVCPYFGSRKTIPQAQVRLALSEMLTRVLSPDVFPLARLASL